MTVYAEIDLDEREALREVAIDIFGPEFHAIIEPGTVSDQGSPELAFSVPADTPDDAVARGRERLAELRHLAGVEWKAPVITAIAPAGPLHLLFGADREKIGEFGDA